MKRDDFVFTLGFEGNTAIVDSGSRKRYRSLSSIELAEKGLYRQAFCSALYSGEADEMQQLLEYMRRHTAYDASSEIALKRLFGVFEVPEEIIRTLPV